MWPFRTDRTEKIPDIILQLDFRKAFDKIEWPVIQQVLSVVNFDVSINRVG